MKEKQKVVFEDLGMMRYQEAWDYQTSVHKSLVNNKLEHRGEPLESYHQEHRILLVEHPHVYTLGKSGSVNNLLLSEAELHARGVDYFPINRGGDITYHGPGQMVGYPILDLEYFFTDVHRYVRNIEEVIIRALAEYGIAGTRISGYTGVWIEENPSFPKDHPDFSKRRKICAIGVHLSRWTTLHGWAFNVNTDLEYFRNIIPCGIEDEDKSVTSLANELGSIPDIQEVKAKVLRAFESVFACEIIPTYALK